MNIGQVRQSSNRFSMVRKFVLPNGSIPHTVMSEVFEAGRIPSAHGFRATIKNPQPRAYDSPMSPFSLLGFVLKLVCFDFRGSAMIV